jgi:hypothetical protein
MVGARASPALKLVPQCSCAFAASACSSPRYPTGGLYDGWLDALAGRVKAWNERDRVAMHGSVRQMARVSAPWPWPCLGRAYIML